MINPAKLLKLKSAWNTFSNNHPKFPKFLNAARKEAIDEGTLIEIKITSPSGKTLSSNIRLTESDKELFDDLTELFS